MWSPRFRTLCASLACASALGPIGLAAPALAQQPEMLPASVKPEVVTAWLRANTDIDPGRVISVGGDYIVALIAAARVPDNPIEVRLDLRMELVGPATIQQEKARSGRARVEVDCNTQKARLIALQFYEQRNLKGAMRSQPGWSEWASVPNNSYLMDILSASCRPDFKPPLALVAKATASPPAAAPAQAAMRGPATPPPTVSPAAAEPKAVAPALHAPPTPLPPPAPVPTPGPSLLAVRPMGSALAQIGASASRGQAEALLRTTQRHYAGELLAHPSKIETISVEGQPIYRVLIGGFGSKAEADRFCSKLEAARQPCLVKIRRPG